MHSCNSCQKTKWIKSFYLFRGINKFITSKLTSENLIRFLLYGTDILKKSSELIEQLIKMSCKQNILKMQSNLFKLEPHLYQLHPVEDDAVDCVVTVLNKAKFSLGQRQNLGELSHSRDFFSKQYKVRLSKLDFPLASTGSKFISDTIERIWHLTPTFMYHIKYQGITEDEISQFYYFEVIFSQPTAEYPIPQSTCSVFFRLADSLTELPDVRGLPTITFRVEGQHTSHDIRHTLLTADQILGVIQMKINFFKSIEKLRIF